MNSTHSHKHLVLSMYFFNERVVHTLGSTLYNGNLNRGYDELGLIVLIKSGIFIVLHHRYC